MRTAAVTTEGQAGETYPAFQARVAGDAERVREKCAALDQHVPRCTACGETCEPSDAGDLCKENGMPMISRWAQERAAHDFYALGNFGGSWSNSERALAVLLDHVRSEALSPATPETGGGT